MPELRENAELPAKGIHIHTSLIPISRLDRFLSGRQGLGVLDVRSSSLLAVGIGHLAFFFLTARHNKQANKRKTNTGWAVA